MKRLVIAIDCDDVLVPGTEFSASDYNRRWGTDVQLADAHSLTFSGWGVPRGPQLQQRFEEIYLSDDYADMAPYPEAIPAVQRLASQHELHVVTARSEAMSSVTERMIKSYFPGCFNSLRHVSFDGSKGGVCEAIRADVLIDDNLRHLLDAKKCGVTSLIWFGDFPWQAEDEGSTEGVSRCLSWNEVEAEIAKLAA
jgi:5'(3')-deoxyribonucleotidase